MSEKGGLNPGWPDKGVDPDDAVGIMPVINAADKITKYKRDLIIDNTILKIKAEECEERERQAQQKAEAEEIARKKAEIEAEEHKIAKTEAKQETEKHRMAREKAEKEAITDTLTGFKNRRGLNLYKESIKNESNHYPIILISVDLDNLKKINDNTSEEGGHGNGDKYILSFVKFINEFVGEDCEKFRLGGDEFLIAIENPNSDPEIIEKISQLYSNLDQFNEDNEKEQVHQLKLTYSTDLAISDEDFYEAEKRADGKLVILKEEKKKLLKEL